MHRWRRLATLTGALALAAAVPPGAGAAAIEYDQTSSGALTIVWRGDPARGCEAAGLCEVSGSLTLRAGASSSGGSSSDEDLQAIDSIQLHLDSGVARVVRGDPAAPAGVCTDLVALPFVGLSAEPRPGGLVSLKPELFERAFTRAGGGIAGRCAGPLAGGLADALPNAVVERAALRQGVATIDLSGRLPFADGPFSGEVTSTIVVRRETRRVPSARGGLDADPIGRPERGPRRLAIVELRYRVARGDGTLLTEFAGVPHPFCLALDACGLTGTHELRLTPGAAPTLSFNATGPARALRGRHTVAGAIAAIRAGRLRLERDVVGRGLTGAVAATAGHAGGPVCRASRDVALPALTVSVRRTAVRFALGGGDLDFLAGDDPLRTRCPGPARHDLPAGALAAARLSPSALGRRRVAVALLPATGPGSEEFVLRRSGRLDLELRRVRARVRVVRFG